MNFELKEIEGLSGEGCQVFSVLLDGEVDTLFDNFIIDNFNNYEDEVTDIYNRIKVIGNTTGARESFFKDNEGKPGDGVCALYDSPNSNLRLYCIRFGHIAIILGGGGFKSKKIKAWQEDKNLKTNVELMMFISKKIKEAILNKDIKITEKGLIGEFKIIDDE